MKTLRKVKPDDRSDSEKNVGSHRHCRSSELCGHSCRLVRKSRARHAAAEFPGNLKRADMQLPIVVHLAAVYKEIV